MAGVRGRAVSVQQQIGVLDIETDGDPFTGRLLCIGWRDKAYTEPIPQHVLDDLADDTIAKVVFTKYDHRWLRLHGIDVAGPVVDVQVMAWLVNERTPLDLEFCARTYCGIVMDKRISSRAGEPVFRCDDGSVVPLGEAPLDQVAAYNERDLTATEELYRSLLRLIRADEALLRYWQADAGPLTPVLLDMETAGLPIDLDRTAALADQLALDIDALDVTLRNLGDLPDDFNLGSAKQLGEYLYSRTYDMQRSIPITSDQRASLLLLDTYPGMPADFVPERIGRNYVHGSQRMRGRGLKVHSRTESGQASTSAKVLKVHHGDDPWVEQYLELAQRRTVAAFLAGWLEQAHEGRLYGSFNQTGTKTGRLSSSRPNLQNVPARGGMGRMVRSLFVPEPGTVFVHGDYGQLEPRLMAHFSHDPVLTEVYAEGRDIYLETARRVFGCTLEEARQYRAPMKTYVLALGYGSGAKTLRRSLAEAGHRFPQHEVDDTLARLKGVYRVLFDWKESVISDAQNEGYVETLAGNRRHFGGSRREVKTWKDAASDERQAVNAVVQGSAADIVARTMLRSSRELADARLLVQVHDELLWQVPTHALSQPGDVERLLGIVQRIAEQGHGFDLRVPLEFEPHVVASWAEGKD